MGDVIPFDKVPAGQTAWMSCECSGEPKPMHVIALAQERPVITALACPECEATIPVENGIPDISRAVPGGEGSD